jgi:hypothetical protein
MNYELIKIAAQVMKVTSEEAEKHYKKIPEIDAYYFWSPVRGGIAVIISDEGEKLGATSSVSFEKHLQAFKEGRRN